MITSRVKPLAKVEGAKVDGAEGVERVANLDRLERNYASLRLTVAASIAPITCKWLDKGKGIEKWRKILMIAKGKMSLSQVAISLYTSMMERIKWDKKSIVRCSKSESKNQARGLVIEL